MNWNKDKSLKFTRVCIYLFAVILVGCVLVLRGCIEVSWSFAVLF